MGNDAFALVVVVTDIYFNPRSRVGNDTECPFSEFWEDISIHVPAWGTTLPSPLYVTYLKFQSTFPRGERLGARKFGTYFLDFNPRSRVGNDCVLARVCAVNADFNPRSRVGNDSKFSQIFFVFLCNKYNFSTFYYPFSLFFSVIHVTFLIFVVRILPAFYVYF